MEARVPLGLTRGLGVAALLCAMASLPACGKRSDRAPGEEPLREVPESLDEPDDVDPVRFDGSQPDGTWFGLPWV